MEQIATLEKVSFGRNPSPRKNRPNAIVYADEAGMDSRDDYAYGWNEKGKRFHALKSGGRQGRVNMIAAYCNHQLIAPLTIDGACNRTVFETWIEKCLIGSLKLGQWLVIDNAAFHKGGGIEQLIEQAGCKVLYLPPYSPDLNKTIEMLVVAQKPHPPLQERI